MNNKTGNNANESYRERALNAQACADHDPSFIVTIFGRRFSIFHEVGLAFKHRYDSVFVFRL